MSWRIVRFYQNGRHRRRAIRYVSTLEEAQRHCRDSETSSNTCTKYEGKRRTKLYGPWFDGYEEVKE